MQGNIRAALFQRITHNRSTPNTCNYLECELRFFSFLFLLTIRKLRAIEQLANQLLYSKILRL